MAPKRRSTLHERGGSSNGGILGSINSNVGGSFVDGPGMMRSPISISSPSGGVGGGLPSASPLPLPSFLSRIPYPRRRTLFRSVGSGAFLFVLLWAVLLFAGALDPDLHVSPHINERTYQVMSPGDPRTRGPLPPFVKPPGYWEFQANWNAPSFELLSNQPPSQRKCDKNGPLLFIGLFTHPGGAGRRQIIRSLFKPDLHPEGYRIDFKFILGVPPNEEWRYALEMENKLHNDIVILEEVVKDNIDEGKSIEYFKWMTRSLPDPKPQFVMKMDDDTFLVMPNVIRNLASLNCSDAVYWGTMQGSNIEFFGRYMRGLCYGMSWPLASWIGTANVSEAYAMGVEDAKIGRMISSLDPQKEPVQWVDHGWKMGDWDQLKIDQDTIGFHWLKMDHWVPMVKLKALKAWSDVKREYRWDYDKI